MAVLFGADVRERAERHLGGVIDQAELQIRLVRDVAPNKRMLCVTFRVPERVAFPSGDLEILEAAQQAQDPDNGNFRAKRAKLNGT